MAVQQTDHDEKRILRYFKKQVINIRSITIYNFCKFVDNLFFCINVIVLTYKTWYCGHTQIFDPIQNPLADSVNLQISTGLSGRLSKMYKQVFLKEKQHDDEDRQEIRI